MLSNDHGDRSLLEAPTEVIDPVESWLSNFPRNTTKNSYRTSFKFFTSRTGKNAIELLELAKKDERSVHDLMKRTYTSMMNEGFSAQRSMSVYVALRSFFRWNDIELGRAPRGFRGATMYEQEKIFTQEQVAQLVDASP
jgi:hypothetical protein